MAKKVVIYFEGIMVLCFDAGETRCLIGVPPTDARHEFVLKVNGSPMPIAKISKISVQDSNDKPIPARVIRQSNFFDRDRVIDFKSANFHPGGKFKFKEGNVHRHRLDIVNGEFGFDDRDILCGAMFKRGASASLPDPNLTRDVVGRVKLTIPIDNTKGQKVVFKNGGSELKLDPDWRIDITNICEECYEKNPDFMFYYRNAFDIPESEQVIPYPPFPTPSSCPPTIADNFVPFGSPGLPCWVGGYVDPPDQPGAS